MIDIPSFSAMMDLGGEPRKKAVPNIFLFASWFLLIIVSVIAWRRAEPERKVGKTLTTVVIFFVIHTALAFMLFSPRSIPEYCDLFLSGRILWFAQ